MVTIRDCRTESKVGFFTVGNSNFLTIENFFRRNGALAQLALNRVVAQQVQEEMQNVAEQAVQQRILDQATNGQGIWQNNLIWPALQR